MVTKFEKFFNELQAKGVSFQNIAFKDLTEDQSHELHNLYLDQADERVKSLEKSHNEAIKTQESINKEAYDKEVAEKARIQAELTEIKTDIVEKTSNLTALTYAMTKKVAETMLESAKSHGSIKDVNARAAIDECKKLHKDIEKSLKEGTRGEFTIKTDVLTTSVTNSTLASRDSVVTTTPHRLLTAYDSIPKKEIIPANSGGYHRFVSQDKSAVVRAAAQVAEGVAAPESTIVWVEDSIKLKKTSDHIPYSLEFSYDFKYLIASLSTFLTDNVKIEVDDQIIAGDNIGDNYAGIVNSSPAYVPVAAGVSDANTYDLIIQARRTITDTEGSQYQPNIVYMNSSDIDSGDFGQKKDADNNYMNLKARLSERGIALVENNAIVANTFILGDNRFIKIVEDGMLTIKTGITTGNDAIEGIERILVTTRKNVLIKPEQATAWRECTDITAALIVIAA